MPNDYYNVTDEPENATTADAADINIQLARLEAAFDMLPAATALTAGAINFADADTGAANAYVVDIPLVTSYYAGLWILFPAANANTGASVVNVTSLGNKAIKTTGGDPLDADQIVAGGVVSLIYSAGEFQLLNPAITLSLMAALLADAEAAALTATEAAAEAEAYLAAMTTTPTFDTVTTDVIKTPPQAVTLSAGNYTFNLDVASIFTITAMSADATATFVATDLTKAYQATIKVTTTGAYTFTALLMTGVTRYKRTNLARLLQPSGRTVVGVVYDPVEGALDYSPIEMEAA